MSPSSRHHTGPAGHRERIHEGSRASVVLEVGEIGIRHSRPQLDHAPTGHPAFPHELELAPEDRIRNSRVVRICRTPEPP